MRQGDVFGRLTVIGEGAKKNYGGKTFSSSLCRCDCGAIRTVVNSSLSRGHTKSCGCLHKALLSERRRSEAKHAEPSAYVSWCQMRSRCFNESSTIFHRYGGRGITVCDRWNSFDNFLADMGTRPPGTSIDRIDVNGNYEPGNCRWATQKAQCNNTRRTKKITYNGVTCSMTEWAERLGMPVTTLQSRIRRGWEIEKALTCHA